jgi:hypothetical protein
MPLDFPFRPGRKPPYHDSVKPRLWVDDFLPGSAPATTGDWASNVNDWPMSLNDQLGTCGLAGMNNWQIAESTYGDGDVTPWPDSTIMSLYEQLGSYVPGDPSTDNGTNLQDNLDFWRNNAIEGTQILGFGALRPGSWMRQERLNALRTLGPIYLGLNLPASAEQQFPGPWTFVPGSEDIGGHCVILAAELMGADEARLVSWQVPVHSSRGFLLATVEEAWVILSEAGLERNQQTQYGVDVQGLNEALSSLTGESNPLKLTTNR